MSENDHATTSEPSVVSNEFVAPAAEVPAPTEELPTNANAALRLPNGMLGKAYTAQIELTALKIPACEQLDATTTNRLQRIGVTASIDGSTITISGAPIRQGEHRLELTFRAENQSDTIERTLSWFVNADPQSLWKTIEPHASLGYRKEHTSTRFYEDENVRIIAASRRGRAHAHEGKFREDDYVIAVNDGWCVVAVSDGAGSAKFSREGSRIACGVAVDRTQAALSNIDPEQWGERVAAAADGDPAARKHVMTELYGVLCGAAFDAYKSIEELATSGGHLVKDYAATLLLSIWRNYGDRTFVATFWIGDGAIATVQNDGKTAVLMGTPDGGEFSGQTRFLTMADILGDAQDMLGRVRFLFEQNVTAVLLMSDGISDPKFGTTKQLTSDQAWNLFWTELVEDVQLNAGEGAEQGLLQWMDFWSTGEHDDRTLVAVCNRTAR